MLDEAVARTKVRLSGAIGVRSIGDACQELRTAMAQGGPVDIDLAGLTDLDVTLIQLLESARRSAPPGGVRLAAPASGLLLETLQRGGFLEGGAAKAFWLEAAP